MKRDTVLDAVAAGDPAAVFRDMRVRGLYSPYYFVKSVLNRGALSSSFHLPELERFVNLLAAGNRRQGVEWFRGSFKSTCFTQGISVWLVCPVTQEDHDYARDVLQLDVGKWRERAALHNQDLSQLLAFENSDNASLKLLELQWHFEQNEVFRACYPEIAYRGDEKPWNSESLKIRRSVRAQGVGESTFEAIGVGGALQSRHYDVLWGDDLVGKAAVESENVMDKTVRWWGLARGALRGAALGIDSYEFLISNRWGFDDLNSRIRKGGQFIFHTRSLYEADPETGEDKIAFPERFTQQLIDEIRSDPTLSRYDFACQFLNNPVPPGDAAVDTSKIHEYRVEPDGVIVCSCGYRTAAGQLSRFMHYDPYNAKGVSSKSAPALVVVGLAPDKHVFLLEYFVAKEATKNIVSKIVEFNDVWRPVCFTYEDVGAQAWIEFHLRELQRTQDFKDARHRQFTNIRPSMTKNKSMSVRVRDRLFPIVESGKFSVRPNHRTFRDMLATFPHPVSGHDYDLLDALAQGPEVWVYPQDEDQVNARKSVDDERLAAIGQAYTVMTG